MDISKLVLGIIIGSLFTGLTSAIAAYFSTINDYSSTPIGSNSELWLFSVIIGLVFGIVVGAVSSSVITGFNLTFLKAMLLSGIINLVIVVVCLFLTNEQINDAFKYFLYCFIPIGFLNGAIVSWFTSTSLALK